METNYEAWLAGQVGWLNEQQKMYLKTCRRYVMVILIVMSLGLFALGFAVGDLALALQDGLIGLLLGGIISFFCWAVFHAASPRVSCLKSLKKEMQREFPQEFERDRFAKEMLEMFQNQTAHRITWESPGGRTGKVEIVKEYAILFWANSVSVVKFGQVERMELGKHSFNIATRSQYGAMRRQQDHFVLLFHYYNREAATLPAKKRAVVKQFDLPAKELRDKVVSAIEEVQGHCYGLTKAESNSR